MFKMLDLIWVHFNNAFVGLVNPASLGVVWHQEG